MGQLIFITGGRRSGKSSYALELAESMGSKRLYLATAQALDPEMEERIAKHKAERGDGWDTAEEPVNIPDLIGNSSGYDVILIDCLTLWLCNVMHEGEGDCPDSTPPFVPPLARGGLRGGVRKSGTVPNDDGIIKKVDALVKACRESKLNIIAVTNELGSGVIPENSLSRRFTDLAGIMNQKMAKSADKVVLTVSGIPMVIKGEK